MKYWLSHLPLEVWVDCYRYPWISREELGRIVHRFGNRKYAEYLQFYLHDWGKRTLKPVLFYQQKHPNPNVAYMLPFKAIPQTPMPTNIKRFECVYIRHFDQRTLDFLRQIQPLLTDIQLKFYGIEESNLENLRVILANMVPLFAGIHSLCCNARALPTVGQCFDSKLDNIKMLSIFNNENAGMDAATRQTTVNFLMGWLTQPQPENVGIGPKWCEVNLHNDSGFSEQISAAIHEEFLAAKEACTFALYVRYIWMGGEWEFAEFHLQNGLGEELHGVQSGHGFIQIVRHQANGVAKLGKWMRENQSNTQQNHIDIQSPTVGQIDAIAAPENVEKEEQAHPH